eukprot:XP_001697301.1 predicted protein [Chlamydomonas reinhardtii]
MQRATGISTATRHRHQYGNCGGGDQHVEQQRVAEPAVGLSRGGAVARRRACSAAVPRGGLTLRASRTRWLRVAAGHRQTQAGDGIWCALPAAPPMPRAFAFAAAQCRWATLKQA